MTVDVVIDPNTFSIRPSGRHLLIATGLPSFFLLLGASFYLVGGAFKHPQLSIGLAIGGACFLALVGAYAVAYVRNTRLFSSSSMFGRRDWRRQVRVWPKNDLAEVRLQSINWGGGSMPRRAYLFISREHRILFRLEPNFWREQDVRAIAAAMNVSITDGPTLKLKEFASEFPDGVPRWLPHSRTQLALFSLALIGVILIVPVVIVVVIPRIG